ncbi:YhgE/Pip domain-containing protein [Cohnella caldifontis]|uniref:YhgE/Pip domain-containing protein n=1 Tax=Cohnella caldifontis TaxID=3027471 RepID=UPI0023ED7E13|nr:YhgE/Pip domain-containing protein [Cohnella sp. YIM B05605]
MNPFRVFVQDVRHFLKNPMLIVTFAAVACIPILYSGFLIRGSWDPYGNLANLPVAVVNLDRGADFGGTFKNVGEQFVSELKENPVFRWSFVSAGQAESGMLENRYYASVTIPESFSADAASLTTDQPRQAEIVYESNSYYNFIAGQISENAVKELRTQLSENLTEAYTRSVTGQFAELSAGLKEASEGAAKLNEGAAQLGDGVASVRTHLGELSAGAARMHAGASRLAAGAADAVAGAAQVNSGASSLAGGLGRLASAGKQLQAGAADAAQEADSLAAALQTASAGGSKLESGLAAASSSASELSAGAAQAADGLQKLLNANAGLAADAQAKQLLNALQSLAQGAGALSGVQKQLAAGVGSLAQGQGQLAAGAQKLASGARRLEQGLKQENAGLTDAAAAGNKLAQGAGQLRTGISSLRAGVSQLVTGSADLEAGANRLQTGTAPLATGAAQLADGTAELADKLAEAADRTAALNADDRTMRLFAQPVSIRADDDRHIKRYGYGIAPYFISIALFAGSLVFTTIFSPRGGSEPGAGGFPLFVSKGLTFGLMSLAQSLILCTVLTYALGLQVRSVPWFYAFTAVTGLAFMFIAQAFATWLDQPGRFLVLVLMVLQLASSAGTFPVELLPGWAKALHPWLPMTYSVQGFRDAISSGDYADLRIQLLRLAVCAAAFLAATSLYFLLRGKEKAGEQTMPAKA